MGTTAYALRVIEGRMAGHSFELPVNSEFVIGRGNGFDIVIDEDMVSRRHAKVITRQDEVVLQDLGSIPNLYASNNLDQLFLDICRSYQSQFHLLGVALYNLPHINALYYPYLEVFEVLIKQP